MKRYQTTLKALLFVIFEIGFFESTYARVDLRTGSYGTTYSDTRNGPDRDLLKLSYESRSDHQGFFGYGWCAEFESRVHFQRDGSLAVFDCQGARQVWLRFDRRGDNEWVNVSNEQDRLTRHPRTVTRSRNGKTIANFDRDTGFLLSWSRDGRLYDIDYTSQSGSLQSPLSISSEGKTKLSFHYLPKSQRIAKAIFTNGPTLHFEHEGLDLVSIRRNKEVHSQFRYDELHNIVDLRREGQPRQTVRYFSLEDRVSDLIDESGCQESYSYRLITPSADSLLTPWREITEITLSCPRRKKTKSRLEVHSIKTGTERRGVTDIIRITPISRSHIQLDPRTGQVIRIDGSKASKENNQ